MKRTKCRPEQVAKLKELGVNIAAPLTAAELEKAFFFMPIKHETDGAEHLICVMGGGVSDAGIGDLYTTDPVACVADGYADLLTFAIEEGLVSAAEVNKHLAI